MPPWGRSSPANICSSSQGPNEWHPCRATTPSPFPNPAQSPRTQLGPVPLGEPLAPAGCLPWLSLRARASATTVSITCCGDRCALHPTQAMCWGNSAPGGALQAAKGFVSPDPIWVRTLTRPLCPQVLLFLQEKEEENHQASQVSCRGRVERRARGLLSLWPWLDLDPWSRRRRPLGLDGAGAEPAGLPRRPTRRRGAGPPQTACPFLRHSPSAWPFTRTKPDFAEVPASV